ncbi:MAG: hypothetical protein GY913_22660 [Proteobacteria bacterium]|nr:hypothetical protein [Pseudomonadota bacterium]MCP4919713.1 hypothetical protein [Pseudomonadota bacterium]
MTSILALLVPNAMAADHIVSPDGDFTNLQDAVDAAADGDRIIVDSVYPDVVVIEGRSLTIEGLAPEAKVRELHLVGSTIDLAGVTIHDAMVVDGGTVTSVGMRFEGRGAMDASAITVIGGSASFSGARIGSWDTPDSPVAIYDGEVSLDGLAFQDTSGDDGGAVRIEGGVVSISGSDFDRTTALDSGGAISASGGTVSIDGCSFAQGVADQGGFLAAQGSSLSVSSSSFDDGFATTRGGAIFTTATVMDASDLTFSSSEAASYGGAIAVMGGAFSGTDIGSSAARSADGGHIWAGGGASMALTRSVLRGGQAERGGAVYNEFSELTVKNAMWTGIEYAESGGGYYQASGSMEMEYAVLADNVAEIGAGFAVAQGDAMLEGVIVYGNHGEAGVNAGTGDVAIRHGLVYANSTDQAMGVRMGEGAGFEDPMFVSPSGGDWALGAWSPGLDRGPAGQVDFDATAADMGAFGGASAWDLPDADEDGWVYGRDCDDADADIHETAIDHWYDGIDSDCRQNDDFDQDWDGHAAAQYGGDDCDDTDPTRNPSVYEESRDQIDSDCDGLLDRDADGDGWSEATDCDDLDPNTHPGAYDAPYDGIDADCRGDFDDDYDNDGWPIGEDCDDEDPRISPSAPEISGDGIDQDCDGSDLEMDLGEGDAGWPVPADTDDAVWYPDSPAQSTAVTTGCSSAPSPSNLAAVLMVLGGILLHRRRR